MFRAFGFLAALSWGFTTPLLTRGSLMAVERAGVESLSGTELLARYCFDCHGSQTQEAGMRFDSLEEMNEPRTASELLQRLLRVVSEQEMPPDDAPQPTERQRSAIVSWAEARVQALESLDDRQGSGWANRRLTVAEYEHTMQSLFGIDATFADLLPADPVSPRGYRNASDQLGLSSLQVEAYLDSARRAIDRYVRAGSETQSLIRYFIEPEELYYSTAKRYDTRERAPKPLTGPQLQKRRAANRNAPPRYVSPLGPTPPGAISDDEQWRAAIPKLHQYYLAIPKRLAIGELIVRVRAAGTADRGGRFPRLRVEAGITLGDGCSIDKRIVGEADVTASLDNPQVYEFRIRLENVPSKGPLSEEDSFDRLSVFDMDQLFLSNVSYDDGAIFALGRGAYATSEEGAAAVEKEVEQLIDRGTNLLHLESIEIEMLPGVGPENRPYRWTIPPATPDSSGTDEDVVAAELIGRFMTAAYRRPITAAELETKMILFGELRSAQLGFEQSVCETLAAVLISPSFLFLQPEAIESDSSYNVASRLSYLLWLSPPDDRLLQHASDGTLWQRDVLQNEARRMLDDARSDRFLASFCRQWLRLDKHSNVAVDRELYPAFDSDFANMSLAETVETFVDVVRGGRSALELIDSDFVIVNDRLAQHYGIEGVSSGEMRRVRLADDSVRGGLLTQASLLTMNSDGVDSHPIRRGVWLLDRLLNSPPPPPPPQVPELEDDDEGVRDLSLKERIERHREPSACQKCHREIDPWGIALENFDAIGKWRDTIETRNSPDAAPPAVDSATVLASGKAIDGVADLKRHLLEKQSQQFADAFVQHLLIYTLGRPPRYSERVAVEQLQLEFRESGYRIDKLILAIIDSSLFLTREDASDP